MISRNLLFLLAQATTNTGIVLVETAQSRQKAQGGAIRELENARELLSQLRVETSLEMSSSLAHSDTWISLKEFIIETETLHVLVSQWLGIAFLHSNQIDHAHSAREVFSEGWSFFQGFDVACLSQLLIPLLNLAVETINTTSVAADVGYSKLETKDCQLSPAFEENCLLIVTEALTNQAEVVRKIEALNRSSETVTKSVVAKYWQDNNLAASYEIENLRDGVLTWWNEMQKQTKLRGKIPVVAGAPHHEMTPSCRSMLSVGGGRTRQFKLIAAQGSKAWTQLGTKGLMSNPTGEMEGCSISPRHVNLVSRSLIQQVRYKHPECFRKWGDEIVRTRSEQLGDAGNALALTVGDHQLLNGGLSHPRCRLLLSYPTTAPTVPLELQRVHEAPNLRRHQERS